MYFIFHMFWPNWLISSSTFIVSIVVFTPLMPVFTFGIYVLFR
jgi:hypothetical protein